MQLLQRSLKHSLIDGIPAWAAGFDLWKDYEKDRGNLPNLVDTHAQTIYAPNKAGIYTSYVANQPVRTDLGLQTVPTRTNAVPSSSNLSSWSTSGSPTVANDANIQTPLGVGSYYIARTANVNTSITLATSIAIGNTVTISAVVKAKSIGGQVGLRFQGNYPDRVDVVANLNTGTILFTQAAGEYTNASSTITPLADGWYRITATGTVVTSALQVVLVGPCVSGMNGAWEGATATLADCYVKHVQCEIGAFASPPILTTSAAATVNGNQQVIDLTGRLGMGFSGLIQTDVIAGDSPAVLLEISDGSDNNKLMVYRSGSNWQLNCYSGAGLVSSIVASAYATGVQTFAFAFGTNFSNIRKVGEANPGADTIGAYGVGMNTAVIGSQWWGGNKYYMQTSKLALSFGPQDATTFDRIFRKAELAHAAL